MCILGIPSGFPPAHKTSCYFLLPTNKSLAGLPFRSLLMPRRNAKGPYKLMKKPTHRIATEAKAFCMNDSHGHQQEKVSGKRGQVDFADLEQYLSKCPLWCRDSLTCSKIKDHRTFKSYTHPLVRSIKISTYWLHLAHLVLQTDLFKGSFKPTASKQVLPGLKLWKERGGLNHRSMAPEHTLRGEFTSKTFPAPQRHCKEVRSS